MCVDRTRCDQHTRVQTHACKHSNNPSRVYPANIDPYCTHTHTHSQCKQVPTYVFDLVYLSLFGVRCSHHALFSLQTDEAASRCGRSYIVPIRVNQKTHNTKQRHADVSVNDNTLIGLLYFLQRLKYLRRSNHV